jgi:uncharacterized protein involved in propanediol utilization
VATTNGEPATGVGTCHGHHGELIQGAFRTGPGGHVRALVTLPFLGYGTRATAAADPELSDVVVRPAGKIKAARAAARTLRLLNMAPGCRLTLGSTLPTGWGMGSSTADVVAAIRAVADLGARSIEDSVVARIAVAAEGASDSLMFPGHVTLFAQREGRVLRILGRRLPPLVTVGCNPGRAEGIDTLSHPPAAYSASELRALDRLLTRLRIGIRSGDCRQVGRAATESARLNQRFLPTPRFEELLEVGRACSAIGIQVAHSGTVAGLLFDQRPATPTARCHALLAEIGITSTWEFRSAAAVVRHPRESPTGRGAFRKDIRIG